MYKRQVRALVGGSPERDKFIDAVAHAFKHGGGAINNAHGKTGDVYKRQVLACSDGLQVWSELLREPSFLALQKARDCSSRELVGTIMEQVKDMLEPQQDNASVWAAVMRKPCTDGK